MITLNFGAKDAHNQSTVLVCVFVIRGRMQITLRSIGVKVCLNRYSWGAGKLGSEYCSWFMCNISVNTVLKRHCLKQDSLDQCPMSINTNQNSNFQLCPNTPPHPEIFSKQVFVRACIYRPPGLSCIGLKAVKICDKGRYT